MYHYITLLKGDIIVNATMLKLKPLNSTLNTRALTYGGQPASIIRRTLEGGQGWVNTIKG